MHYKFSVITQKLESSKNVWFYEIHNHNGNIFNIFTNMFPDLYFSIYKANMSLLFSLQTQNHSNLLKEEIDVLLYPVSIWIYANLVVTFTQLKFSN